MCAERKNAIAQLSGAVIAKALFAKNIQNILQFVMSVHKMSM